MQRATIFLHSLGAGALLAGAQPAQAQGTETAVPAPSMGVNGSGPNGATLRCTDGTWIVRDTTSVRCASHGGVQLRIAPGPPPRAPRN